MSVGGGGGGERGVKVECSMWLAVCLQIKGLCYCCTDSP